MIDLINVSKSYGGLVKAVDNLNLTVSPGEIFGFLGPNGAGKTTTLKMVTGILSPDQGVIRINNIDIQKDSLKAKMQFGFVPDSPDMFLRLKGIEYLNFMADIYLVSQEEMMKEHTQRGNTVFFSTHVLEVAEKLCDRVAVINKGKLLFHGTLEEMREHFSENESLEHMFLEMTENE